jgi:hypothetical protein
MNISKLLKVVEENSWLLGYIGPPHLRSNIRQYPLERCLLKMIDWAEDRLDFVAFRPFESLDLAAGPIECKSYGSAPHNWGKPKGQWSGANKEHRFQRVCYTVCLHIEGEEKPRARSREIMFSYPEHDDGQAGPPTIRDTIKELVEWSKEYWTKQVDRKLVFDMVVKIVEEGWSVGGVDRQIIEIYRFPENFDPTQV